MIRKAFASLRSECRLFAGDILLGWAARIAGQHWSAETRTAHRNLFDAITRDMERGPPPHP
ncbi:hypothetical protein NS228_16320 [Methylobacterium indicum]|nr:hypothetical protein NS229_07190 [Methylobacterium indicum]KTS39075.1 hypothetical protein NS228_16320 [Methylobacterium indicum]KTS51393.1 hypothetical protein NS230_13660 [Methylobacterium indicum]